jgi:hypothetical protein
MLATCTNRALFEAQVTYTTPRIIGSKRRKGILIINGAEMAIIRLQQSSSNNNRETEATVLVSHLLSKVGLIFSHAMVSMSGVWFKGCK